MPKSIFSYAYAVCRPLSWNWLQVSIPFFPPIGLILFFLFFYFYRLHFSNIDSEQLARFADLAIRINTILLAILGAVVYMFREGMPNTDQRAGIREAGERLMSWVSANYGRPNDPERDITIETMRSISKAELNTIFDCLFHASRLHKWASYSMFTAIFISSLIAYFSAIGGDVIGVRVATNIIESICVVFCFHLVLIIYPYLVKHLIISGCNEVAGDQAFKRIEKSRLQASSFRDCGARALARKAFGENWASE